MLREISSGGVVVRHQDGTWWAAVIEPQGDATRSADPPKPGIRTKPAKDKTVLCLPKGLVDPGEKALDAALREVKEETGITAELIIKLADIKYMYVRTWSDGERVFKIVSFYLLKYQSGKIDNITEDMRIEVARALWVPLADAPKLLAYKGEKQMARQALEYLSANPNLVGAG